MEPMRQIIILTVAALTLGGCVSSSKYRETLEEKQSLQSKAEALGNETENLRAASAAQAKEAKAKIEDLEKRLGAAEAAARAGEEKLQAVQKEAKDLKKFGDLLRADNERLERSLRDCRDGFAKAAAKIRAALEELTPPQEPVAAKPEPPAEKAEPAAEGAP